MLVVCKGFKDRPLMVLLISLCATICVQIPASFRAVGELFHKGTPFFFPLIMKRHLCKELVNRLSMRCYGPDVLSLCLFFWHLLTNGFITLKFQIWTPPRFLQMIFGTNWQTSVKIPACPLFCRLIQYQNAQLADWKAAFRFRISPLL